MIFTPLSYPCPKKASFFDYLFHVEQNFEFRYPVKIANAEVNSIIHSMKNGTKYCEEVVKTMGGHKLLKLGE